MTKHFLLLLASAAFPAICLASTGKTADGCTYRVINGQYLTSCEKAGDSVATTASSPRPVTSYGSVPMRSNPSAPVPSVQQAAPQTLQLSIVPPSQGGGVMPESYDTSRRKERDQAVDSTYVGAHLGSTTIKEAGEGIGFGLALGTNIDDHFGFELGYSYAKQDLSLGLEGRGAGTLGSYSSPTDSALKAHLITGEMQGYLTDTFKRLRPYLGLGLGWKSSTLEEKSSSLGTPSAGGSLSQSSVGGIGSAGAKLRIGKALQLGFAFRYFFPIARQESRLEQPRSYGGFNEESRLSRADDTLTGASQYQILGGLQYAF